MGHSVALAPNGHVQVKTTRLCVHIKCTILDSSFFWCYMKNPCRIRMCQSTPDWALIGQSRRPRLCAVFQCQLWTWAIFFWPVATRPFNKMQFWGFWELSTVLFKLWQHSILVCLSATLNEKKILFVRGGEFSKKINCHAKVWGHYPPLKEITTLMHQGCIILTKSESVTVNTFIVLQKICFK